MAYQLKKQPPLTSNQQGASTYTNQTPSKFQRKKKQQFNTPEQTNPPTQIPEPIPAQEIKIEQINQRPKIISRTNRLTQKKQETKSPAGEQGRAAKLQRTVSPSDHSQQIASSTSRSDVIEKDQSKLASQKSIEMEKKEEKIQAKIVKRSSVYAFIVGRLLKKSLMTGFAKLRQNKTITRLKYQLEAKILFIAASELSKRQEQNCYSSVFQKLKAISNKNLKSLFQSFTEPLKSNAGKMKQNLMNILHFVYKSKLRQPFIILKQKKQQRNNILKGASVLLKGHQKKTIKQTFLVLKKSNLHFLRKKTLINQIGSAYNFNIKQLMTVGFRKLFLESTSKLKNVEQKPVPVSNSKMGNSRVTPSKPHESQELSKKLEKLVADKEKSNQDIIDKQVNLETKKRQYQNQRQQLKKQIEERKNNKQKVNKEVVQKKAKHQSIKKKLQVTTKPLSSQDLIEPEKGESMTQKQFVILQQLYSDICRMNEQDINPNLQEFLIDHQVDQTPKIQIVDEWNLIKQKRVLQRQINFYENSILGSSSLTSDHIRQVLQQFEVVGNMVKNFIRQRYLWGEVQKLVASAL